MVGSPRRAPPFELDQCDRNLVEGGLAKPRAGYGGVELYVGVHAKAAALAMAFARSQRCPDGNKRLALILMLAFLGINGYEVVADEDETADMMLGAAIAADDDTALNQLRGWLENRVRPMENE